MANRGDNEDLGPVPPEQVGTCNAVLQAIAERCDLLGAAKSFPASRLPFLAAQAARCRRAVEDPLAVHLGYENRYGQRLMGRATHEAWRRFESENAQALRDGDTSALDVQRRWALRAVLAYEHRVFEAHGPTFYSRFPQKRECLALLRELAPLVGSEAPAA